MIPPQTNFKLLEPNIGNIYGGVSFRIVIGGWIGQFELFKRNATKDIFLIIFQNFLNSGSSNIPWNFFWYSDIMDCRAVALEKKRQFHKDIISFLGTSRMYLQCSLYSSGRWSFLQGNSTTYVFLIISQSFWRISKHLHEIIFDGV